MKRVACCSPVFAALLIVGPSIAAAERDLPAFTDPKQAGLEYQLQGEYVGKRDSDEGEQKIGVQVIALGDNKFRAVAYVGGLPGDGWARGDEQHEAEGEWKQGQVEFRPKDPDNPTTAILKDGKLTVLRDKRVVLQLKRIQRKSKTLGARPPKGATVLFDGRSTAAWVDGKIVEKQLLAATHVYTKQKFGDHQLHIEFRTPFMPTARGQQRGNSGVYIQSRYECQVLDSFGLEGENNECGGIYSISKPAVNMCYPPLSWQTYDIDFTAARYDDKGEKIKNARVTIKHNGVVIHDDLELTHGTPGRHPEGPGKEAVYLQDHGNPVVYRNIWAIEK